MIALILAFIALCFAIAAWFTAREAMQMAEDALFTAAMTKVEPEMAVWEPDDAR